MPMKFINFMKSSLTKFDTPKNSKLAKISGLKFIFKKPIPHGSNQMRAQNLSCVESTNSYILLIDVISFKLRLINSYTFF